MEQEIIINVPDDEDPEDEDEPVQDDPEDDDPVTDPNAKAEEGMPE